MEQNGTSVINPPTPYRGKGAAARMNDEILTGYPVSNFLASEKCAAWNPDTRRYYTSCLQDLLAFTAVNGQPTPELIARWESELKNTYARSAVNVHLAAANNYFKWCGRYDLLRGHTRAEAEEKPSPALTRLEYLKLLRTARAMGRRRAYLLIKTFASIDLPLQCLGQVTVELVRQGRGALQYRGGALEFYCPGPLQAELLDYSARNGITCGPVFVTRNGKLMERPGIFRSIQEICRAAGVPEEKGNPRALRNLYKITQCNLDRRLAELKQQMYDQLLEMEQEGVAWPAEDPTGCTA